MRKVRRWFRRSTRWFWALAAWTVHWGISPMAHAATVASPVDRSEAGTVAANDRELKRAVRFVYGRSAGQFHRLGLRLGRADHTRPILAKLVACIRGVCCRDYVDLQTRFPDKHAVLEDLQELLNEPVRQLAEAFVNGPLNPSTVYALVIQDADLRSRAEELVDLIKKVARRDPRVELTVTQGQFLGELKALAQEYDLGGEG